MFDESAKISRFTRVCAEEMREQVGNNKSQLQTGMQIENVVARDGVEPPTPAFSERNFPVFPTTSMVVVGLPNTGKKETKQQSNGVSENLVAIMRP